MNTKTAQGFAIGNSREQFTGLLRVRSQCYEEVVDFETLGRFKRINVVGTSGSGKSTFARELSMLLNLPYVEMGRLFWKPNWQEPSDEEFS